ncbi:hypothetical protein [Sulfitobacter faviae]|uniref:hypothetical protein n=1 Tax=Sulfitobacter faviae TaxID=1775881 RepID=UPI0024554AE3|nr:hypothetical protein [Sulfitobacter faviae]
MSPNRKTGHVWLFSESCTAEFSQELAGIFPKIKKLNEGTASSEAHVFQNQKGIILVGRGLVDTLVTTIAQRSDPLEKLEEWKLETANILAVYRRSRRKASMFLMEEIITDPNRAIREVSRKTGYNVRYPTTLTNGQSIERSALHWLLAEALATRDVEAQKLSEELEASSIPLVERKKEKLDTALAALKCCAQLQYDADVKEQQSVELEILEKKVSDQLEALIEADTQATEVKLLVEQANATKIEMTQLLGENRFAEAEIEMLLSQIISLQHSVEEVFNELQDALQYKEIASERDREILSLNNRIGEIISERDQEIKSLNVRIEEIIFQRDKKILDLNSRMNSLEFSNATLDRSVKEKNRMIEDLYQSSSWRITAPLRFIKKSLSK